MAEEVKLQVIEQCQVSPPTGSLPSTTIPLSYLDLPWFYCTLVKQIFFYEFPYSKQHFLQTVLPILKQSLSLTLQHFFPFASNVVFPPKPQTPHILYSQGDSVSFTVVESTADFIHLVSNYPRDVRDMYPFVPVLPSPRTLEDGTLLIPTMAIQVTIFANSGFAICVTFRHEIADGRGFHNFMKFWASICRSRDVEGSLPLPLHKRDIIGDPKGLEPILLEELWNFPPETEESTNPLHDVPDDMVRQRFLLSRHQVEKLKNWVAIKCQSNGLETMHLSTFVVTCSLFWVCKVKLESEDITDDYCCFIFHVDWRNRPEISIPATYFGNCLTSCFAALPKRKLVGENGFYEAVNALGSQVRGLKGDPLKGVELFKSVSGPRKMNSGKWSQRVLQVAGSPKLKAYETDFGWGKPKLSEMLHSDDSSTMFPSDCRDQDCGIEVGLVLKAIQMKKFTTILEEQLERYCVAVPE